MRLNKREGWWAVTLVLAFAGVAHGGTVGQGNGVVAASSGNPQSDLLQGVRQGDAGAVKKALEAGADAMKVGNGEPMSPAHLAIALGDEAVILTMLDAKVDVVTLDWEGWSALDLALVGVRSSATVVERLVSLGLRSDKAVLGWPALGSPAAIRSAEVVRVLVKAGYSATDGSSDGWTPVQLASFRGNAAGLEALLAAGGTLEANRTFGSPLSLAAARSDAEVLGVVKVLVKAGVDLSKEDARGWTPLGLAIYDGSAPAVRAMLEAGAPDKATANTTSLCLAAQVGNVEVMRLLLAKGFDVNEADPSGMRPLNWALRGIDPESRKAWLDTGLFKSESREVRGILERIERMGPEDLIETLLKAGADPNRHPPGERAPLTVACGLWDPRECEQEEQEAWIRFGARHDASRVVKLLADAGAVRKEGRGAQGPVDRAATRGDCSGTEMIRILRSLKVDNSPQAAGEPAPRGGQSQPSRPRF